MENKKKQLTVKELEQVMGGVLKPIQVHRDCVYECPYCRNGFSNKTEVNSHMKVCSLNPDSPNYVTL